MYAMIIEPVYIVCQFDFKLLDIFKFVLPNKLSFDDLVGSFCHGIIIKAPFHYQRRLL